VIEDDRLKWKRWTFFVQPDECPDDLTWKEFDTMMGLVNTPFARRGVRNPFVSAVLDLLADIATLPDAARTTVCSVAAKNKLSATHWRDVPDAVDLAVFAEYADSALHSLSKALGKFWPFKMPDWASDIKNEYTRRRAQRNIERETKDGKEARKDSAAETVDLTALAHDPSTASGAEEPTAADSAGESTAAPGAGDSTAAPRARAPVRASGAGSRDLIVGDIVRLDHTVGKCFWDLEAQVIKVRPQAMSAVILEGKLKDRNKNIKQEQCKLVRGSTLRTSLPSWRSCSAASAPAESAASAPDAAAAAAAALAVEQAADAAEAEAEEEQALARELGLGMNSDEDEGNHLFDA